MFSWMTGQTGEIITTNIWIIEVGQGWTDFCWQIKCQGRYWLTIWWHFLPIFHRTYFCRSRSSTPIWTWHGNSHRCQQMVENLCKYLFILGWIKFVKPKVDREWLNNFDPAFLNIYIVLRSVIYQNHDLALGPIFKILTPTCISYIVTGLLLGSTHSINKNEEFASYLTLTSTFNICIAYVTSDYRPQQYLVI